MDEKDLKQIREVVREEVQTGFHKAFGEVWESNLEPAFGEVNERIDILTTKLDKALYHEFDRLEKRVKVIETKLGIAA